MAYQLELNLFDNKVKNTDETPQLFFTKNKLSSGLKKLLKSIHIQEVKCQFYLSIPSAKRSVYEEFKKLLPLLDGKWDKGKNIHVCVNNPQPVIDKIINQGFIPDANPYDFYPTPEMIVENELFPAVGLKTVDYNSKPYFLFEKEEGEGLTFFDPNAGDGSLLKPFIEKYPKAKFFACEIESGRRKLLEKNPFIEVLGDDFLEIMIDQEFDFVVMNPPFRDVVRKNQSAWIQHIEKAFSLVSWRGSLASIVPETCFVQNQKNIVDFRNWVLSFGDVWRLPNNAFKEAGTQIQTRVISLKKEDEFLVSRMWHESEGYSSRFTYLLCLGLDNDRTVHDALEELKLSRLNEKELRNKLGLLVSNFLASEMKHDRNYFFNERVHRESVEWLLCHLSTE